jgi:hypothetical protein
VKVGLTTTNSVILIGAGGTALGGDRCCGGNEPYQRRTMGLTWQPAFHRFECSLGEVAPHPIG